MSRRFFKAASYLLLVTRLSHNFFPFNFGFYFSVSINDRRVVSKSRRSKRPVNPKYQGSLIKSSIQIGNYYVNLKKKILNKMLTCIETLRKNTLSGNSSCQGFYLVGLPISHLPTKQNKFDM